MPVFTTRVAILDLRIEDEEVTGDAYYLHTTSTRPVDVRWSLERKIDGFIPISNGVVYVRDDADLLQPQVSPYIRPERLGASRYGWFERLWDYDSDPWLMLVVVCPENYLLTDAVPAPLSAKELHGRLAMYWMLKGDDSGHARLDWTIIPSSEDVGLLAERLNRISSASSPLQQTKVRVDAVRAFLCHSSGDKERVRELYNRLKNDGFEPWFDEESILPGRDWDLEIRRAIKTTDAVIVCLSHNSLNTRGYVQKEIKQAFDVADEFPEGSIYLIPAKLEPCEPPERLGRQHWVNLYDDRGYDRLVAALQNCKVTK